MTEGGRAKGVPAVGNAVAILDALSSTGRPMGATEISRTCGLGVSSAFNILRTLAGEGLVAFDETAKTYRPGYRLLDLAAPLLGAAPADLLRPLLEALAADHGVAVALWQVTPGERIVLIDRFAAAGTVQAVIAPDSRLPAFAGAVGRVYAARSGHDRAAARRGYHTVRWQDPPGFDDYWRDVERARTTGVAADRGHLFRGLEIRAALAVDAEDRPRIGLSSITIAGQHDGPALEAVAAALRAAALKIERAVFGRRPLATPDAPIKRSIP